MKEFKRVKEKEIKREKEEQVARSKCIFFRHAEFISASTVPV